MNLFEEAAALGRSIIYDSTSTGGHIPTFLAKLKERDFQVVLLLCSCPEQVRQEAIKYQNQVVRFYQSSPEDALAKGKFFALRMGAYFAQADLLYLYWSDCLFGPERLAAIWRDQKLEVLDQEAMDRFAAKYEEDRALLEKEGAVDCLF